MESKMKANEILNKLAQEAGFINWETTVLNCHPTVIIRMAIAAVEEALKINSHEYNSSKCNETSSDCVNIEEPYFDVKCKTMREKERENKINDIIDKIAVVFNDLEHKDDEQNAQLLSEIINDLKKLISECPKTLEQSNL
jgi:hypothetical protein